MKPEMLLGRYINEQCYIFRINFDKDITDAMIAEIDKKGFYTENPDLVVSVN